MSFSQKKGSTIISSQNQNTNLSIVNTQCSFNYIPAVSSNSLGIDEMSTMVGRLMEESASTETKIKELQTQNSELLQAIKKAKNESHELSSYKDKFTDIKDEYSQKEKEIEQLQEAYKKKTEEIDKLKKETEHMKQIQKNIKEKEKEIEQAEKELNVIKNFPKEDLIREAVNKAEKAEQEKSKLDKELERYMNKLKSSNDQLRQLTREHDDTKKNYLQQKEELLNSKQQYENKINALQNEITQITELIENKVKKYQDSLLELKTLQDSNESLRNESSSIKSETHKLIEQMKEQAHNSKVSMITQEQIKETYTEQLALVYSNEMSISFIDIINEAIQNFPIIIQSCFINENDTTPNAPSVTYSQDIVRELYYLIYWRALDYKFKSQNKHPLSFDILNENDFNDEIYQQIIKTILKYNEIARVCKGREELIENINKKIDSMHLNEEITENIKKSFKERTDNEHSNIINAIMTLIKKCTETIVNGNIQYNKKILFKFESYITNAITLVNNSLTVDLSQLTNINSEYLITMLKYPKEKEESISKVLFTNSFNYEKIEYKVIFQIFYTLLTYSPQILSFSLVSCPNLNMKTLEFVLFLIKNLKNVKILRLEGVNLNDQSMQIICEEIKDHKSLKALMLSKNQLASISGSYLAGLISDNKNINILYLDHNNITSAGLVGLLTYLGGVHNKISKLDLSYNSFQNEDFEEIGKFLKTNPKIQLLNLSGNKMEMQGCIELGVALNNAKQITQLNLSNNNINSDNSPQLFQTMHMEELILDENPLGVIGLMMLSKVITSNATIKKLSLKKTNFDGMGVNIIISWLKKNQTLKEIHLEENSIDENGIKSFSMLSQCATECKVFLSKGKVNYEKNKEIIDGNKNLVLV